MIITPIMKTIESLPLPGRNRDKIERVEGFEDIPVEMPMVHFPELERLLAGTHDIRLSEAAAFADWIRRPISEAFERVNRG